MTINFLSFGSIPEFHDRSPLTTSPIGEMTNQERLYSKDPDFYPANKDGITLVNFYSKNDKEESVSLDPDVIKRINDITLWLVEQAKAGNLNQNAQECLQQLRAQFTKDIEIISIGEMVTNSVVFLPSFVEMKLGNKAPYVAAKTWYATGHFAVEYPYREILVDLPLPAGEIDFLCEHNHLEISQRLALETQTVVQERIRQLTEDQKYPYTDKHVIQFDFIDVVNNVKIPIFFNAIIYGNPTDVEEQLYETIKEQILNNSVYDETVWEEHLPDLFNPLEFTCIPYWDRMGSSNETKRGSSHSPIGDYETLTLLPIKYCPTIKPEDLIKSLQTIPFMFQSTLVGFVAKAGNYSDQNKITKFYPDYRLISLNDVDNGLMEPETIHFIKHMESLLSAGKVVGPSGIPPTGIKRLVRYDKLYVTKRIGKINFLVPTYWQMIQDGVIDE